MGSSYKTDFLGLNRWIDSDKPKREDFVSDNELVDAAIRQHSRDELIHITENERSLWNSLGGSEIEIGTYAGNGEASRVISLGYTPLFAMVFRKDALPVSIARATNMFSIYFSAATRDGGMVGLKIGNNSLNIEHLRAAPDDYNYYRLNDAGITYCYVVVKP